MAGSALLAWALLALLAPRPAVSRLGFGSTALTGSTFDSFIARNEKVLIDFYSAEDPRWPDLNSELQSAVREVRDFGCQVPVASVDVLKEPQLAKRFVPNGPYPHLMWFKHGEPTQYHRTLRKSKNIMDFMLALDRDPLREAASEEEVRKGVNRAVYAMVPKASKMYKMLEVVAAKHMDTVEFAFHDSKESNIRWLEEGKEPVDYAGEANVDAFEHWVRGLLTKSEPLPEPQAGDSAIVVGQTFEDLVLRPDKDVFLLIYAPWCGFSRKMVPIWESFAREVAQVPHLVVAKMDGDLNGSPYPEEFRWNAYPTVFFVKAGTRTPEVFHGNRTVARLVEFAQQHGSQPFRLDRGEEMTSEQAREL
mmetsp:Transcript_8732/g.23375  ORF Transcript_8732/g.23375 Transcript_8732/m.23375 type:complete len:363 (-) Transcript_8732:49-1137(-)